MTTEGGNGQAPDAPGNASTPASTPAGSETRAADAPRADLLLEVTDLVTHFETDRGTVRSVDGVSLSLEAGRTLGIVGESGSGKTVLSRSIMGLLPKRGTVRRGSVRFEGTEIAQLSPKQMREYWGAQMAMIFQDPMTSLNPVMKIGKQITESHPSTPRRQPRLRQRPRREPARVGPHPRARASASGSTRTSCRAACASGSVSRSRWHAVRSCCSPTSRRPRSTSPCRRRSSTSLRQQQDERFMAMVLITHDLGVVAGRADEIAVMYAGRIVEHAPTAVLFENMKMPYTEALLSSIPKLGEASHTRLATIPGRPPDLVHPPAGCKFAPRCAIRPGPVPRGGTAVARRRRPVTSSAAGSPSGPPRARPRSRPTATRDSPRRRP